MILATDASPDDYHVEVSGAATGVVEVLPVGMSPAYEPATGAFPSPANICRIVLNKGLFAKQNMGG
jgi:hypothetical protein